MRPNTIQEYLRMANAKGFEATCEGLLHYKRTGEFMELKVEEQEETKSCLPNNVPLIVRQIKELEQQGFTTDQAIEILKLSATMN